MATPIEMPKLGNTVNECLIARWCKRSGDTVAEGELLAEIETDKATFELTAPVSGTLLGTFFDEGDLVPFFANICVLGKPGESIDEFLPQKATILPPAGGPTPPPIKVSTVRERIGRRMRYSLSTTAQYTLNASAAATGLLALRARIKARTQRDAYPSININEMVMYCAVKALEAVPEINVAFVGGKIYQPTGIHIAFACDTPKGLLAPVIRDSQKLTIAELALKIKALTKQAVEGSIALESLSGGTFTVSNLGSFGVESFSPILNPPQVAILGVNSIQLKPVRRDRTVDFIEHIGLSLTCDHQVIDGAPGARFLKIIKGKIESIQEIAEIDIY
jgi:pyruvate dehydrogenase E2 component (dihydrolipoamide acetyltransferase)